jgi:hypothetical protein
VVEGVAVVEVEEMLKEDKEEALYLMAAEASRTSAPTTSPLSLRQTR